MLDLELSHDPGRRKERYHDFFENDKKSSQNASIVFLYLSKELRFEYCYSRQRSPKTVYNY